MNRFPDQLPLFVGQLAGLVRGKRRWIGPVVRQARAHGSPPHPQCSYPVRFRGTLYSPGATAPMVERVSLLERCSIVQPYPPSAPACASIVTTTTTNAIAPPGIRPPTRFRTPPTMSSQPMNG